MDKTATTPYASDTYLRLLRSHPHFYSVLCKALLFCSRNIAGSAQKRAFHREKNLFAMNEMESRHCNELRRRGITILHDFFEPAVVDQIYQKADCLFKSLRLTFDEGYSVRNKQRSSLQGLTYEELETTEKVIYLEDPLRHIPECIPVGFNETILKITTNFMGYIPQHFAVAVVRDFPHNRPKESSNFHKDFDDVDSIPAFIYLVDTLDETDGAFVYVPSSNRFDARSCSPRLSRDLGDAANDGRISDPEVEKFYPRDSWMTVRARRGSVVIFHGNGIHKGPCWKNYGDSRNRHRTAIRLSFGGFNMRHGKDIRTGARVSREQYEQMSRLQRLFTQ